MRKAKTEKHGMEDTPTYSSWAGMKTRCTNKKAPNYKYYGERGIKVCSRWNESFIAFYKDMGEKPHGQTLDRIDSNKDYTSDNCKWSTAEEQARNRTNNKLTEYAVSVIKYLLKDGVSKLRIARAYRVSPALIHKIHNRQAWASVKSL